jgi:inosose dehydratase
VGGFTAVVLHEDHADDALDQTRREARLFSELGGEVMVLAVVADVQWSARPPLDDREWGRLARNLEQVHAVAAEFGVTVALHPHHGTLIQTSDEIELALQRLETGWCLDTGHLLIGGVDPAAFAHEHGDRVVHVHLKDVDASLVADLRAGASTLLSATRRGLFVPLGEGDAGIGAVLSALDEHGYDRWLVLEQDTAITGDEPVGDRGPMHDARESIAFLQNSAPSTQEVNL